MRPLPWSGEDDARLIEMHMAGVKPRKIADMMGRSYEALVKRIGVLRYQRKLPLARKGGRAWTPEEDAEAIRMRRLRWSVDVIAGRLNRPISGTATRLSYLMRNETKNIGGPCPAALADRDRRASLSRPNYTAEFFGDPLPGYSALDRKEVR